MMVMWEQCVNSVEPNDKNKLYQFSKHPCFCQGDTEENIEKLTI